MEIEDLKDIWKKQSAGFKPKNERELAEAAQYVPMTDEQLDQAHADFEAALEEVGA